MVGRLLVGEAGGSAVVASVDGTEVVASVGGCAVEGGAVTSRYRRFQFIMKTIIFRMYNKFKLDVNARLLDTNENIKLRFTNPEEQKQSQLQLLQLRDFQ